MSARRSKGISLLSLFILFVLCILLGLLGWQLYTIPHRAEMLFGKPNPALSKSDLWAYSSQLLIRKNNLLTAVDPSIPEMPFQVEMGESISSIANRLEMNGLIRDAESFRLYLIYSGLDYKIQAGEYRIKPSDNSMHIARSLTDSTPTEVPFNILAGWRIEEIAAALPTSGLMITSEDFIQYSKNGTPTILQMEIQSPDSLEGFLFPGSYLVGRETSLMDLLSIFVARFEENVDESVKKGFEVQDLDIYQAVILASMVEREAINEEEQPIIASVFHNRLAIGMKLDSDPTVQYALGFDGKQNTWWTNPLSMDDLQINSPYNTYINPGLPPKPICNPGLSALRSVAFPVETPYYYFQARCDGSGMHEFAETFEQHLNNSCP